MPKAGDIQLRSLLIFALVIAGGYGLYLLSPILTPFLISALLAYIGDPVVDRLEARRLPRTLAVLVVFLLFALVFLLMFLFLIPLLHRQVLVIVPKIPGYLDWLQINLLPWLQKLSGTDLPTLNLDTLKEQLTQHWQQLGGWVGGLFTWITQEGLRLIWLVASLALIPVVTFYLLRDWDVLVQRLDQLLPSRQRPRIRAMVRETDEVLSSFLRGQLLVMLALGVIYSVGLSLIGLDMAMPIGILAGLVSFVPYLGLIIGILAAGIAALLQFQDPTVLIWVAVVFLTGQLLESFLLTPRLVGDRIGLHPVAVIFAVLAGGQLFGFFGILLALPVAAVLMVLLRHLMKQQRPPKRRTGAKLKRRRQA